LLFLLVVTQLLPQRMKEALREGLGGTLLIYTMMKCLFLLEGVLIFKHLRGGWPLPLLL
jgi:hypothetical protein